MSDDRLENDEQGQATATQMAVALIERKRLIIEEGGRKSRAAGMTLTMGS